MTITKRHHTAALKFANEVRARLGKRPVKRLAKGIPGNSCKCTIARTIDRKASISVYNGGTGAKAAWTTNGLLGSEIKGAYGGKLVNDFIKAFDDGEIPELRVRP